LASNRSTISSSAGACSRPRSCTAALRIPSARRRPAVPRNGAAPRGDRLAPQVTNVTLTRRSLKKRRAACVGRRIDEVRTSERWDLRGWHRHRLAGRSTWRVTRRGQWRGGHGPPRPPRLNGGRRSPSLRGLPVQLARGEDLFARIPTQDRVAPDRPRLARPSTLRRSRSCRQIGTRQQGVSCSIAQMPLAYSDVRG